LTLRAPSVGLAGVAMVGLGFGQLRGQEALRTAVQGDRAYETRQIEALAGHPSMGIRAGPVAFAVGATLGVEYLDNVRYTEVNPQDDIIISPGVTLGASWAVSRTARLTAGVGLAYRKYLDFSENDYLQVSPESQVAMDIPVGDLVFTVYDTVSYSQDVMDVAELTDVSRYPRLENTAGLTVSWIPEKWLFQLGYAYGRFWAFEEDYEYLDRGSHQFFSRFGRFIFVKTRAGVEGSVALTQFDEDVRNDSQSYSFGPFADWYIREGIRLGVRGGYVIYAFDAVGSAPAPENVEGGYGAVEFSHQLTGKIRYNLYGMHLLETGIQSAITERTDLRFSIRYDIFNATYIGLGYNYSLEQRDGPGLDESYSYMGPVLTLGYNFNRRLQSTLSYQYRNRDSDLDGRDYQVNRVALSVRYSF